MRHILLVVFCLYTAVSIAQKGDFLITNHFPRHSNIDNSNFEITSDHKGRLCIANRSGVLKYDGEAWDYYQTPSAALSLAVDSSNIVYVGCIGSVGMIDFHERRIIYKPLMEIDTLSDLFLETKHVANKVYYMGSKNLIVYDIESKETAHHTGAFVNIYELDEEVFINTEDEKTYLVNDSLSSVKPDYKIAYASSKKGKPNLAVDFNNQLIKYENYEFKKLPHNRHIENLDVEVKEIQWINDSLFVCSTFEKGLILFNINDSKYVDVTDFNSGLPDNELYAIHADNSNGIWAAHQFGITHIAPLFPAYSYSHFLGLEGNLTSVSDYNNDLWVTTSLGLFYFATDTVFENKVYYTVEKKNSTASTTTKKTSTSTPNKNNKSGLKRLFGKKERANKTTDSQKKKGFFKGIADFFEEDANVELIKGKRDKNTKYVRRVRKVPVDINYSFKKIDGANGKFISVIPYKGRLLGISTSGIYEISKKDGAQIIISESIRSFLVNKKDQLILSTNDLEIKIYHLEDDIWIEQISQPINDIIVSMQEEDQSIWMAGSAAIYRATANDTSLVINDELPLNNIFLDEVNILRKNETLYFINSQGYYFYDAETGKVLEDETLKEDIGQPVHHLYDAVERSVWIFNGKVWYHLTEDGPMEKLEYLGLFPDLRAVSIDGDSDKLWLITQNNELLSYDPAKRSVLESFDFFLKKVSNENGEIDQSKKFTLSYDENFLSIELSKPDFLGLLNPEFQYKLKGLHSDWSEWTRSKSIDFSFIPEGNYNLMVRSRDAFGRVEEDEVLSFSVKPPYWQTPWFYAIQIFFFGGLVYFSTRLNQDSSKNRLLQSGLTLLTLVLIIEFLQSAIGSLFSFKSTPVADFLLDAVIAFMIFPLERLLRELMTKGKVKVKVKIDKEQIPLVRKNASSK